MPPRILITHGRTRASYVVAKSLRRAGFEVYVSDASRWNMTRFSRSVCGFDRTPPPFHDPARYMESLAEIIRRRKIDLLLPGLDDAFSIRSHAALLPAGVIMAAPPYEELSIADDKVHIVRVAENAGVAAPKTLELHDLSELAQTAQELGFPLIVKARRGGGGKGVFLVHAMDELIALYQRLIAQELDQPQRWPVLQAYIGDGQLFGTCFLAKEGRIKAIFCERYLRCERHNFGTSVLRERCDWQALVEATERLVDALHWTGIGHFDFIANGSLTEATLLEMNPRWWGALNLAVINGFDFPLGFVTMMLDGEPAAAAFCEVNPPRKSLWILGEAEACRDEIRHGKLFAPLSSLVRIVHPGGDCAYDDFAWRDPLPLAAEFVEYFGGLLRNFSFRWRCTEVE